MADEIEVQATTETAGANDSWDIDISDVEVEPDDVIAEPKVEDEAAPEVDEADPAEKTEDEAEKVDVEPAETKETDQFTLKYLGEDKTVSREEIIPLAQKGMDYDRQRQKVDELTAEKTKLSETLSLFDELAKARGFVDAAALADETRAADMAEKDGIDILVARDRIAAKREREEVAAEKAKLQAELGEKDKTAQETKAAEERKAKDIEAFTKSFPDVKPSDIPAEVWKAVGGGESLAVAYRDHKNRQEIAELKAQLKNTENKQRSTGPMTTDGQKKPDSDRFVEGWNSLG